MKFIKKVKKRDLVSSYSHPSLAGLLQHLSLLRIELTAKEYASTKNSMKEHVQVFVFFFLFAFFLLEMR